MRDRDLEAGDARTRQQAEAEAEKLLDWVELDSPAPAYLLEQRDGRCAFERAAVEGDGRRSGAPSLTISHSHAGEAKRAIRCPPAPCRRYRPPQPSAAAALAAALWRLGRSADMPRRAAPHWIAHRTNPLPRQEHDWTTAPGRRPPRDALQVRRRKPWRRRSCRWTRRPAERRRGIGCRRCRRSHDRGAGGGRAARP